MQGSTTQTNCSRNGILVYLVLLTLIIVAIAAPIGYAPRYGALNPQPLPPRWLPHSAIVLTQPALSAV